MYKTILVPLDGSKLAECVLPHVQALVRGCQANRVVFARIVEPFRKDMGGDYTLSDAQVQQIETANRAEAEAYLKNIIDAGRHDCTGTESVVLNGAVAETLADYAAKNKIDVIVMATHGDSGLSRWVWGNVADRVLRSANVPVLIVRAPGSVPDG